ncbi:syntaxin-binding protein 6 [Ciona intestinalis]
MAANPPSSPVEPRPQEVKHALHKDVFHPNGERLVGFMKVSKTEPGGLPFNKKENIHYLCCSVTVKRPSKAFISRYRKPDKGEGYEQRRLWPIEELTKVDGRDPSNSCNQFDLYFDRAFRFEATSFKEKEEFLVNIGSLCSKYLGSQPPPPFVNVTKKVTKTLPAVAVDTKSQMQKNKQELVERGQKISQLENKTAEMADSAKSFSQTAHELANHYKNS